MTEEKPFTALADLFDKMRERMDIVESTPQAEAELVIGNLMTAVIAMRPHCTSSVARIQGQGAINQAAQLLARRRRA